MSVHPFIEAKRSLRRRSVHCDEEAFIEAEKQGGHGVKRACELLGVSRAAFDARRDAAPGPRTPRCRPWTACCADGELAE
ncbi:hypothetical protein [Nonomuraea fuscirosea]|uniref:hypothetical protein n=1 Tax=Nonomuraea fuscirosea TaxID=1291556 RepID=UPI0011B297F3|nr:hypothetical protein [Nonomuraea fuscirosea]